MATSARSRLGDRVRRHPVAAYLALALRSAASPSASSW